ncbi:MAG: hypothetical protein OXJ52_06010 [Oligoflexia bacterium]|nr:hypothetical protein [Oligoflexia bacterium]
MFSNSLTIPAKPVIPAKAGIQPQPETFKPEKYNSQSKPYPPSSHNKKRKAKLLYSPLLQKHSKKSKKINKINSSPLL